MTTCLICNVICLRRFHNHLSEFHNISSKEYFHRYVLKSDEIPNCLNCNKELEYSNKQHKYSTYCTRSCRSVYVARKSWDSNDERRQAQSKLMSDIMVEYHKNNPDFSKSIVSIKGLYDSKKSGQVIFRSLWELHVFKLLDASDKVISYIVEPFIIPYVDSLGKHRRYKPDLLIKFEDHNEILVEIKPSHQIKYNTEKFSAAEVFCKEKNVAWMIWTEKDIFKVDDIVCSAMKIAAVASRRA